MKVKVIYRNYIPLYSAYSSFWLDKIDGVDIEIPPVNSKLKAFYKVYRKISALPLVPQIVSVVQKYIFLSSKKVSTQVNLPDLLFYTGILPEKDAQTAFIIDFEHIYALFNFADPTEKSKKYVLELLLSSKCKKILPWSIAAQKTMMDLYPEDAIELLSKSEVLYPALPDYYHNYRGQEDNQYAKTSKKLRLLFVGKDYKRKGLIEVLEALKKLDPRKYEMFCISNMPEDEQKKYSKLPVQFILPQFTQEETVRKFFMTSDLFVMPTHEDTFGMVFLEALSCGLPVITTKQFACPEIVDEGRNGFFVESEILFLDKTVIPDKKINGSNYGGVEEKLVNSLIKVLSDIVDDPSIVENMKPNCYKEFIQDGKFSLLTRNKKLEIIFKQALN